VIGAFNTAIEALSGFFSKLFWFGTFLPVAVFAALHFGLAALTFPAARALVPAEISAETWSRVILGLVVLAFALSPLHPLLQGLLDGSLLPGRLREWLVRRRWRNETRQRAVLDAARTAFGRIRSAGSEGHAQLAAAFEQGMTLATAADDASIGAAQTALAAARRPLEKGDLPDAETLRAATAAVVAALEANRPDPGGVPAPDVARARAAVELSEGAENLLTTAEAEAEGRYEAAELSRRAIPEDRAVMATRMGEARAAAERYAFDAYGVEFGFLWPRLLVQIPRQDSPIADGINTARASLNFTVMSLVLSLTLLAWLPILGAYGDSVPLLLLVALGGPLLAWFCWRLAIESQFGMGDAIKVAIDRHRFDVLKELRQPLPASRSAERQLWARLGLAETDHRVAELPYMPGPPGA